MKTALNQATVQEYKNWLLCRAEKIAAELHNQKCGPIARLRHYEMENRQQNLLYFDIGFDTSDEVWEQLFIRRASPTIWDFVEKTIKIQELLPASIWTNVRALVELVRQGLDSSVADQLIDARPIPANHFTYSIILALPASILGMNLVHSFQEARRRLADDLRVRGKVGEAESQLRTTVNIVRRARWFFSDRMLPLYASARKKLPPDLETFMDCSLLVTEKVSYEPPSAELFRKLLGELASVAREDPPVYRFVLLTLWVGLRASEAVAARGAWVIDSIEKPRLHVRPEDDFLTKTGQSRLAWIPPCVFGTLCARSGSTYIVADFASERIRAYRAALTMLERLGFDESRRVHYLRRFYYTAVAQHLGLDEAKESAGHHSHQVGFGHYLFETFSTELKEVWLAGP
jgi:hypothetical protein